MPSKSAAQHRLMAAVANNPAFAKKAGVPQSVGRDYVAADKGRSFSTKAGVNQPNTNHGKNDLYKKEGGTVKESKAMMKKEVNFMKKAGAPKSMVKHEQAEMKGMKKGGFARAADGVAKKGLTKGKMLRKGGMCK